MLIDLSDYRIVDFHAHIPAANNISQFVDVLFGRWLPTCLPGGLCEEYRDLRAKVAKATSPSERQIEADRLSSFSEKSGVHRLRTRFEKELATIPSFRSFLRYVARVHSCPPDIASIDEAIAEKLQNPRKYLLEILRREKIERVVLDLFGEMAISDLFPAEKASWVYRFDRIVQPSWAVEKGLQTMSEVLNGVLDQLNLAREKGCVGFKSAMAYSRNLQLSRPTESQASDVLRGLVAEPNRITKDLIHYQDFLIRRILMEAGEMDLPVLFHLGLGGPGPRPDFRNLDPDPLRSVLDDPDLIKTRVVILHCGYPYEKKAAAMAYQYSNFYVDLSIPILFHGNLGLTLMTFLEFTPHQKLFYGSDAWHTPEMFGYDAHLFKKTLGNVLTQLSARDDMSKEETEALANRILSDNTEHFLKLRVRNSL